ncbi:unnamed protein product [Lupinus luteus]|uniref:non-specific serine/threonine protein kinase n=1 Tax=Lupinus luteus TaxID=3873 RepID=A0AAV1Y7R9_LUPLU
MDSPTPPSPSPAPDLNLDNLKALKILGRGAMGTVFLIHHTTTFALKVVDKTSIHSKLDAERRARWEIQLLSQLSHPFLPSLISTFESQHFLAWALPYCPGGDLNLLRYRQNDRVFSPPVIRFYVAEILCALQHLHSLGIAYRDLKPENVLIQSSGHVTLTDFDLSRKLAPKTVQTVISDPPPLPVPETHRKHRRSFSRWIHFHPSDLSSQRNGLKKTKSARVSPVSRRKPSFSNGERSNSFVGTEEYVSPEVVRGDGHEFAVDWWAMGILTYEMLYGTTPFKGKNRKETFRNVLMKTPEFVGKRSELTDLIEKLLEKDPTKRLGYARGATEIKEHAFFKGVQWDLLTEMVRPPFIPVRDDGTGELTENSAAVNGGVDIKHYFESLKSPPSLPPSPVSSLSCKFKKTFSLSDF